VIVVSKTVRTLPMIQTPISARASNSSSTSTIAVARQQTVMQQVRAEQAVRVAAHRVFGNADCGAEHARLREAALDLRIEREHEVTGYAELRRERVEPVHVGLHLSQLLRGAHADQKTIARAADDADRAARIEIAAR
jgi:hypothetical protein